MTDQPFVAIVVTVPEERFHDDDDVALDAGNYVVERLEPVLIEQGHTIPAWASGGCEEDWGVYFESSLGKERFAYHVNLAFHDPVDATAQEQMVVRYGLRPTFWQRLTGAKSTLPSDHPLHDAMQAVVTKFTAGRMLTQSELDRVL